MEHTRALVLGVYWRRRIHIEDTMDEKGKSLIALIESVKDPTELNSLKERLVQYINEVFIFKQNRFFKFQEVVDKFESSATFILCFLR